MVKLLSCLWGCNKLIDILISEMQGRIAFNGNTINMHTCICNDVVVMATIRIV